MSALGASMVAQLLPKRLGGFAQGMWYLGSAIGMKIGGQLSGFAAADHVASSDAHTVLQSYLGLFYKLGSAAILIAFVLSFAIKPLSKAMQQVMDTKY